MVFLPLPDPRRIVGVPEILLVGRFLQPSLLALSLAELAAVGFGTETLPLAIAIIRKKIFLAVQAFASTLLSFHWVPKPKEPLSRRTEEGGKKIPWEEKAKRRRRKKKLLVNCGKKSQ
jgi:hypothetical protein